MLKSATEHPTLEGKLMAAIGNFLDMPLSLEKQDGF